MKRIIGIMSNIGCGGAEIQSILLFNGLCKKGYHVKLLILDTLRIQLADRLDDRIEKVFIKRNAYFDPVAMFKVKTQVDHYKADVIVMVDNYPILYGMVLKKLLGQRVRGIIILHNTVPPSKKRHLQNKLIYAPSINRLDDVVFVSRKQKEYWAQNYNIDQGKSTVILNGIETEYYESYFLENDKQSLRERLGIPKDKVVIAMNASLWEHKNHDHMLKAMSVLKKDGISLYLLIIGDGPQREMLEDMAKDMNLSEDVMFTGFVRDVRPYLMSSDISSLTSTGAETLSLAAIESMALGKALILSDTGGASEIVDNGINGYLYTPGDINELSYAIRKMISTKAYLKMGEICRHKAKTIFTQERMLDQYICLIEKSCVTQSETSRKVC